MRIQYDIAALERMSPTQQQRQAESQAQGDALQLSEGMGDFEWDEAVAIGASRTPAAMAA